MNSYGSNNMPVFLITLNICVLIIFDENVQSSALERKLNSKTAALAVLSEELEKCRMERDNLKIILESKMSHNAYNRVKYKEQQIFFFIV